MHDEVEIHVRPDGSLKIYGKVRLLDVDGADYEIQQEQLRHDVRGARLKLCRCGSTKTPPFCDESHKEIGFRSEPRVSDGLDPT